MTDWPRIQTDVDDDRPAREDEVEYCQHCQQPVLDAELRRHAGEKRCEECRPFCRVCGDAEVSEPDTICPFCALWRQRGYSTGGEDAAED